MQYLTLYGDSAYDASTAKKLKTLINSKLKGRQVKSITSSWIYYIELEESSTESTKDVLRSLLPGAQADHSRYGLLIALKTKPLYLYS